jgi:hypothetical protein
MSYCNHFFDTQTNEALNCAVANMAPKSVYYSSTISLFSRVALVTGMHNMGHVNFIKSLFSSIVMAMSKGLVAFLDSKEKKRESKRAYKHRIDVKRSRARQQAKNCQQIFKERKDNSYGAGVGLTAGIK